MIIEAIVAQHADDAAFLWHRRDAATRGSQYEFGAFVKLDERTDACLDGLRIAGDAGWEICIAQLGPGAVGELFAAAVPAFENGSAERVLTVLDVGAASPASARALVSALGWTPYARVADQIRHLLRSETPTLRRIGIAACAAHRQNAGTVLAPALSDGDPLLRARALKAAGEIGRKDLLAAVRLQLSDPDEGCRFAAAWAAALLGDKSSGAVLRTLAESPEWSEKAVTLGTRAADLGAAHDWQRDLARTPGTMRLGITAAGHIGDPALVPWLIEQMTIPEHARVAAEAFTYITGLDIAYESLDTRRPDGFESGPTDDPEDDNVAMDPDEDLPWPDPEKIAAWWARNRHAFHPGTRHLLGKPITPASMVEVLKIGRQRQRAAAALQLTLASPGRPLFEVRAPGFRQQLLLNVGRDGRAPPTR